jgi:Tfp pilus assembly protein PilF
MHPELLNNAAFLRYYESWQNDPRSLVFAPIAEFYCQYKLYADARRICEAGVKANPQSVLAHYTLARTYILTREWHAARHEAQWVLARVPDHEGAVEVLKKVEQAQTTRPAEAYFAPVTVRAKSPEKVKTASPKNEKRTRAPWQTITMAKIYAQQGHFVKARTIYKTILSVDPANGDARAGLATVERMMRDAARA